MNNKISKWEKGLFVILVFAGIIIAAFFAANYLSKDPALQSFIAGLGYPGVIILATIAGLNFIIPLPAASFVPLFTEAGLWLPAIIVALTIGTIMADFIGYAIGKWSRSSVAAKYPISMERFEGYYNKHRVWLPYLIFLYASFMPLPNEAMILPLAVLGVQFRSMIIPLFLGNLINQTLFSYGAQNVFDWLF